MQMYAFYVKVGKKLQIFSKKQRFLYSCFSHFMFFIYICPSKTYFLKNTLIVMANKRELKKRINFVCGGLFAECVAASTFSTREDKAENLKALLRSVLRLHSDYIMRVSHPEPGMKQKEYFRILTDSFNKEIDEVVDQIGNMLS